MSENVQLTLPEMPKPQPSSTPPGGTASSLTSPAAPATAPAPTSPPSASAVWRVPATPDNPQWSWNKTAEEVLAVAKGYDAAFQRGSITPTQSVPASAAPAAPAPPVEDETILTGRDWKRLSQEAFNQYIQPAMNQSVEMAASATLAAVSAKHAGGFQKYGPEIQQELLKVPKQYWTLDNLETVVTLVYGRHRDEYAAERAQQLVSQMEPTIRPTGGGSGQAPQVTNENPFESEKIPSDWKLRAKQAGITESTIREFCQTNDMTPEDFWKLFDQTGMQPIVAEANIGR